MHSPQQTDQTFWPKALSYTVTGSAVCVLFISLFFLKNYTVSSLIALVVAAIVNGLLSRHDLRLPKTAVRVDVKNIAALWAIVWLGTPAAVFTGLIGSLAACFAYKFDRQRSVLVVAGDAVATFAVGSVYYFVLGFVLLSDGNSVPVSPGSFWAVSTATVLMAVGHFTISSCVEYSSRYLDSGFESRLYKESFLYSAFAYLITIAATVVVNYTFLQFGLEFGWVVLPAAVIANAAYEVHRKRLATKTREISEASRIHLATVETLATAIDARDQMGVGHVRRTQIFAVGIGELLGLPESDISALCTGALLHDIGKLAVPDHILNKTEELTPAEAEKVKIHASVGASILEKVGFDTPVVPTVKYHHENWDGSGYPEGLKGENIPLTARVLAVADAYDSIRGARPYSATTPRKKACKSLRTSSGTKLDPRIVKIFVENVDRLEAEITRKGLAYRSSDEKLLRVGSDSYVEQIKRANREASTMYELAKDFSASLTLDETLKLLTEKIREFVHFDTCPVFLLDRTGDARAMFVAGKHAVVFNDHVVEHDTGITGRVLSDHKPVANSDPWPDLQLLRSSVTTDFRAMISVPVMADEKLIGAVSLYSTDPAGYTDEHLRLVETITQIAADSIVKSLRHAETESHALTDPMTGLPNARALQQQFERELARAQRASGKFQILMLDLDGFKQVNDSFGHKAGDKMLLEIGRLIKAQLREYDFLARYAGDEFVALLPNMDVEGVYDLCRRIETAVEEFELEIGDDVAQVGVSIGWATYPHSAQAFDQLLIAADKEMYSTKSRRKLLRRKVNKMIPKPGKPLELDMAINIGEDDIDTVVEVNEQDIYLTPHA